MSFASRVRDLSSRMSDTSKNITLLVSSLAFFFFVVEIVARLYMPDTAPGTTWGKPVHHNSLGLRDRDFVIPKPEGVQRVLFLGDSWVWGIGLNIEDTLPKLLEAKLTSVGNVVEVINGAIPGFNTV